MKNKCIIAVSPYFIRGSEYLLILKNVLTSIGYKTIDCSIKQLIFHPLKTRKVKAIVFNWFEELNNSNILLMFLSYCKKVLWMFMLKIRGIKIITTIHNKCSHNKKDNGKLERNILKKILSNSSKIIILCDETKNILKPYLSTSEINNKTLLIPHPNFINSYKINSKINFREMFNFNSDDMVILLFGTLRPYKNIELLLDVASKVKDLNIKFLIAGNGKSDYVEKLKGMVSKNVALIARFIKEEEVSSLYASSDVCIAPLDLTNSLNSSTCIAAFSFKKNIICPRIGTILQLKKDLTYSYIYIDEKQHKDELEKMIRIAYNEFKSDPNAFKEKGELLYLDVKDNNSIEKISETWKKTLELV